MVKDVSCTYQKFMSVYRLKTPGDGESGFDYSTSMHYYNRDLAPVDESKHSNPQTINEVKNLDSPYDANSQEYMGNIVNKAFKDSIINRLGVDTIYTVQG